MGAGARASNSPALCFLRGFLSGCDAPPNPHICSTQSAPTPVRRTPRRYPTANKSTPIRIILVELDIRSCTTVRRRTESDAKFLPPVRSIWKGGYKSNIVHVENHSARETYKVVGHPRLSGLPFIQQRKISTANCFLNRYPTAPTAPAMASTKGHVTDFYRCDTSNKEILRLRWRLNLHGAFAGDIRPNPPRAFSLFHPDNRPSVTSATEMQNHIIACSLCVSKAIEI